MCIQIAKDSKIDILEKDANVSTFINKEISTLFKNEIDAAEISLEMYQGSIIIKTFEFCSKYRRDPFKKITFPIDAVQLTNFYNEFFDDLDDGTLVQIISLADYLQIDPLLQLICYKLSYRLRDMNSQERVQFFQIPSQSYHYSAEL